MSVKAGRDSTRHARMPMNVAVTMTHAGEIWSTEMVDISATGLMVRRPLDWRGVQGDRYVLDMMISHEVNIHLEASVARITEWHIGFAYERIPAEKEIALWSLLGSYADQVESVRS